MTRGRGESGPAGARRAFLFAALSVAALMFPDPTSLPGGASLGSLMLIAGIPLWFAAALSRRGEVFDPVGRVAGGILLATAGFLSFWALLSVVGAEAPFRVGRFLASLAGIFAMYFMVIGTMTRERVLTLVITAGALAALVSLLSVAASFSDGLGRIIFHDTDRAHGFFKNPNQFGIVLSTTFAPMVALALARPRRRLLWVGMVAAIFMGLVMAGSKANLLISYTMLVVLLCLSSIVRYSGWRLVAMVGASLGVSVVVLAGGVLALAAFNERALSLLTSFLGEGSIPSLMSRSELWRDSIEIFLNAPILGEGAGQPLLISIDGETISHSHNVFLEYARTLGVPGLAGMVVIYGTVFYMGLSTILRALGAGHADPGERIMTLGLALASLAYLAANMSSDSFGPATSPFMWLFFFLCCAMRGQLSRHAGGQSAHAGLGVAPDRIRVAA